jgi:hypothetical protein
LRIEEDENLFDKMAGKPFWTAARLGRRPEGHDAPNQSLRVRQIKNPRRKAGVFYLRIEEVVSTLIYPYSWHSLASKEQLNVCCDNACGKSNNSLLISLHFGQSRKLIACYIFAALG